MHQQLYDCIFVNESHVFNDHILHLDWNISFCVVLKCQKFVLLLLLFDINYFDPVSNSFIYAINVFGISFKHFNVWNCLSEEQRSFFEGIMELLKFFKLVFKSCRSPLVYLHEVFFKSVEGFSVVVLSCDCFFLILSQDVV